MSTDLATSPIHSCLRRGISPCHCPCLHGPPRLVAITGGPGGGKSSVIARAALTLCRHVAVLPEVASLLYGNGLPRGRDRAVRRASQRAIFDAQRLLETAALSEPDLALVLCDRGTIDGLAYWPDEPQEFWRIVGSDLQRELARYAAVIHLETPDRASYVNENPQRVEAWSEACALDDRTLAAWGDHPRRVVIARQPDFDAKIDTALAAIDTLIPRCCQAARSGAGDTRPGAV